MQEAIAKINTALISVSDKDGLEKISYFLSDNSVEIISTGGSFKFLTDLGIIAKKLANITKFNEIMDGRVKSLHPVVHGGLLADRQKHQQEIEQNNITPIDLLILNLYPFEEASKKFQQGKANIEEVIENIDIGGPAMLRSGAKNYSYVTVITDKNDYDMIMEEVKTHGGVRLATRQMLAKKAFAYVAYYDAVIAEFFINYNRHNRPASGISGGDSVACHDDWQFPAYSALPVFKDKTLRYGENPHQDAILLKSSENRGIINAEQIQGKDLSYNNINDADAAFALLEEFNQPACVIVKHASPCGVAVASNIEEAYQQAVLCDNVSVFGGIIAINRPIDAKFASEISKIFVEVIIAPDVSSEAREIFARKKNLRILITQSCSAVKSHKQKLLSLKAVSGGYLAQTEDNIRPFQDYNPQEILLAKYGEGSSSNAKDAASDDKDVATGDAMDDGRILSSGVNLAVNIPTKRKPTEQELSEMFFAMSVAKHTKSNAIVLCQGTKTVGISGGQTNRKDSVHFAALRSQELAKNFDKTKGLTLASDAFFPFADGIKMAAEAGVVAIIQPGGSVRDEEVIQEADKHNIAMLFTNIRHFKH